MKMCSWSNQRGLFVCLCGNQRKMTLYRSCWLSAREKWWSTIQQNWMSVANSWVRYPRSCSCPSLYNLYLLHSLQCRPLSSRNATTKPTRKDRMPYAIRWKNLASRFLLYGHTRTPAKHHTSKAKSFKLCSYALCETKRKRERCNSMFLLVHTFLGRGVSACTRR